VTVRAIRLTSPDVDASRRPALASTPQVCRGAPSCPDAPSPFPADPARVRARHDPVRPARVVVREGSLQQSALRPSLRADGGSRSRSGRGLRGLRVCLAWMANHYHLALAVRPDTVRSWSDEEIIDRWQRRRLASAASRCWVRLWQIACFGFGREGEGTRRTVAMSRYRK
jgi:hypothetical protein